MGYKVKLAVKQLVEFVLRSGDIDHRFTGLERAAEGSRIHRRLQKEAGEDYQAEVFLSWETVCEGMTISVEGRADGVFTTADGYWIDEIKSTVISLAEIDEDFNPLHWAQAKVYGYIYCLRHKLVGIGIQLTYVHAESRKVKRLQKIYSREALKVFYYELLAIFKKWADLSCRWAAIREQSIKKLQFPFGAYRQGQRSFAVAVYKTITNAGHLFAQAPTGIGKTISTLFPAVKALGEGEVEKIFYLTAKTVTGQAAAEAVAAMRTQGLKLKTVTLTAKDKVCFLAERSCNPDSCRYAKGHYDRVNGALYRLLQAEDDFSRETIAEYAHKYQVCPFELALDLSLWSDCIICDYNYLFDPQVYLKRFFSSKGNYVFLIDEAHNLVDRAREMFSAVLNKTAFLKLRRQLGRQEKTLYRSLGRINRTLLTLRKLCEPEGFFVLQEQPAELTKQLADFVLFCADWLKEKQGQEVAEEFLQLYFAVLSYLKIAELYDQRYVTLLRKDGSELSVKLFCLDPALLLQQSLEKGKSAIFFSATLTPFSYFIKLLGGNEEAKVISLPSPYPQNRLCLMLADHISTKYKDRAQSLQEIADLIYHTVSRKRGNYIVYFPSYRYLSDVYHLFAATYPEIETKVQHSEMDEQAREEFLAAFVQKNTTTLVGFCVLGGIFAEGIDLKGERLLGTIIIGVGLPQLNVENNVIRDYYQQQYQKGYEYAYLYPGMNKVLQAAGRVIRSESDRGIVLLVDERFGTVTYRSLFPQHWQHYQLVRDTGVLQSQISDFWRKYNH
ncbi:MAG: ATP-dependent DNA helicase [Firmicutes bacterium]|jgi:DNA excision repair protein ERCC-2|nr:ATP-dependent DNA helicase [Bacillota bacterium]